MDMEMKTKNLPQQQPGLGEHQQKPLPSHPISQPLQPNQPWQQTPHNTQHPHMGQIISSSKPMKPLYILLTAPVGGISLQQHLLPNDMKQQFAKLQQMNERIQESLQQINESLKASLQQMTECLEESLYVLSKIESDDKQHLLAGQKRAKMACDIEDGENTKLFNDAITKMGHLCQVDDNKEMDGLTDKEQVTNLASILTEVFWNQVPTNWNHRAELYNTALDLMSLLAMKQEYVAMLSDSNNVESVLYWLDNFG